MPITEVLVVHFFTFSLFFFDFTNVVILEQSQPYNLFYVAFYSIVWNAKTTEQIRQAIRYTDNFRTQKRKKMINLPRKLVRVARGGGTSWACNMEYGIAITRRFSDSAPLIHYTSSTNLKENLNRPHLVLALRKKRKNLFLLFSLNGITTFQTSCSFLFGDVLGKFHKES